MRDRHPSSAHRLRSLLGKRMIRLELNTHACVGNIVDRLQLFSVGGMSRWMAGKD